MEDWTAALAAWIGSHSSWATYKRKPEAVQHDLWSLDLGHRSGGKSCCANRELLRGDPAAGSKQPKRGGSCFEAR